MTRFRRCARILLLDPENRVLLIRFAVPRGEQTISSFWAAPGGGIEEGESELEAAHRELKEELNLDLPLQGPVHTSTARFEDGNGWVENADTYFIGRPATAPLRLQAPTESERSILKELKWWSVAELEKTGERVFPEDLLAVLLRLKG